MFARLEADTAAWIDIRSSTIVWWGEIAGEAGDGAAMRLLYGGSVKPGNAAELMAVENVNGALVGGASLKADDFLGIISVYR